MATIIDQEYEAAVPIGSLVLDDRNANQGDVDFIRESIRANQFVGAAIVHRETRKVLAGNHTVIAAEAESLDAIPVIWLNCDLIQAQKIAIAINEAQRRARWKVDVLADVLEELAELGELEGTGYSPDTVDDIIGQARRELPPEEFEGGYAEPPEKVEERASTGGVTKISQGLREIVVVLKEDDYQRFIQALIRVKHEFATETTSETIYEAVMRCAEECE